MDENTDNTGTGKIYAIGVGPGAADLLTPRAKSAIAEVEVIAGYTPYLEQVKEITTGKTIVSSGMTGEVERCQAAMEFALNGKNVAVISSGDAGVYGMAGLLFELAESQDSAIEIEVVPGITAATAAGAVLGAPLMNDFAVISLSDLLTSQKDIRHRVTQVAEADLVCVLYNPASTKRKILLPESLTKFREIRGSNCICGMVKNATRKKEEIWVGTLGEFPVEMTDMSTVVVIGNSKTVLKNGKMYTKRGYELEADKLIASR